MNEQNIDVKKHLQALQEKSIELKSEQLRIEGEFRVFKDFLERGIETVEFPKQKQKLEEIN